MPFGSCADWHYESARDPQVLGEVVSIAFRLLWRLTPLELLKALKSAGQSLNCLSALVAIDTPPHRVRAHDRVRAVSIAFRLLWRLTHRKGLVLRQQCEVSIAFRLLWRLTPVTRLSSRSSTTATRVSIAFRLLWRLTPIPTAVERLVKAGAVSIAFRLLWRLTQRRVRGGRQRAEHVSIAFRLLWRLTRVHDPPGVRGVRGVSIAFRLLWRLTPLPRDGRGAAHAGVSIAFRLLWRLTLDFVNKERKPMKKSLNCLSALVAIDTRYGGHTRSCCGPRPVSIAFRLLWRLTLHLPYQGGA